VQAAPGKGRYIYFVVDDSFKGSDPATFALEVEYFDAAPGRLSLEFDGSDESAPFSGAYTRAADTVRLEGSKTWRTGRFALEDARFGNGQNHGADFRLVVEASEFAVRDLKLWRKASRLP
jgi:hypothetical protein